MDEKPNRYALAALRDRRATLAGEIYDLKRQLDWRQKQLDHVDACLTIFEPGFSIESIGIKRSRKRVKLYGQGELSRSILDALRRAARPLGIDAIVGSLLAAQGHAPSVAPALKPRVNSNIHYLHRLGRVTKTGRGMSVLWALPSKDLCDATMA
jgi:hypothetical protein